MASESNGDQENPTKRSLPSKDNSKPSGDGDEVAQIPPELVDALQRQGLNLEDARVRLSVERTLSSTSLSGPIPPADMLAEYDEMRPGTADQIIGWAEEQTRHRQKLENLTTQGSESRQNRAQFFAFAVAIIGLLGGLGLVAFGHEISGAVIAATAVGLPSSATLISRFVKIPSD